MQANSASKRSRQSIKARARLLAALSAGMCTGAVASRAMADTWVWTGGGASVANMNWSDSANWNHTVGSSSSLIPVDSADTTVQFAGSANPLPIQDIAAPFLLNSLAFNSTASSFFLQGNALEFLTSSTNVAPTLVQNSSSGDNIGQSITIGNNTNLTVNGSGTGAISFLGAISGSGASLTDNSAAELLLLVTNTYSGGTTINGGAIVIGNINSLGTGPIAFNNGMVIAGASGTLTNNFSNTAGGTIGFSAAPGTTLTVKPTTASSASLNFGSATETGTIDFVPANLFAASGQINVNGGAVVDGTSILSQILPACNLAIASSATLNLSGNTTTIQNLTGAGTLATGSNSSETFTLDAANFSGSITGSGKLIANGGTITLTGSNNYSGGTTLNSGQIVIAGNNVFGTGPITLNGGTITAVQTASINVSYDTSSATSVAFQAAPGTTLTLGGIASLGTATLNFGSASDSGTVNFSPDKAFFEDFSINVNGGTLLNGEGILSQILSDVFIAPSAKLDLNNSGTTISNLTGAGTLATGPANTSQVILSSANFSGVITGAAQLATTGNTVILSGSNSFTGGSAFGGGTVGAGNNSALGSAAVSVTANTGLYAAGADHTLANPISINSGQALTIMDDPNGAHNLTLNGNISGSGSITMSGSGALSLFGSNTYAGGTTLNSGQIVISGNNSLGAGPITLNGGTITAVQTALINVSYDASSATSVAFQAAPGTTLTLGGIASLGSATLNFGSPSDSGTVNFSPGEAFLAVVPINVNGGTLFNGDDILSQILSDVFIAPSATLDLNNSGTNISNLTGAGTLATGPANTSQVILASANFSGIITGGAQLATTGNTVILSGSNSFTGGSAFGGGTVGAGNNSALGSAAISVTANTGLYAAGADHTLANPISINSGQTLTLVNDPNGAHNLTLNGNIGGSGALAMTDTGTVILTALNSYSGGTTFGGGSVGIGNVSALGGGPVTVTANTNLFAQGATRSLLNPISFNFGQSLAVIDDPTAPHILTLQGNITGFGALVMNASNTLSLRGINSYSGGTFVNSGILGIGTAGALPAGSTVVNNATVNINANTVAGNVSGSGLLNVGPLAIVTLKLSSSSGADTQGAVIVNTASTLDITNNTLVINYGSAAADPVTAITGDLIVGRNGGTWTGAGIQSSAAAINPTRFAIGYLDGDQSADTQGNHVAANQLILKYTLAGDAFLQNSVGVSDLLEVARNFGKTGKDWAQGNFNYDTTGSVGIADLLIVAQNYGHTSGVSQGTVGGGLSTAWQTASPVPEPAFVGLLLACGPLLARRRRLARSKPGAD